MKNIIFSKDDILLAILDAKTDSFARTEIVKALILSKLKRLNSDEKFERRKLSSNFGSVNEIETKWEKLSAKDRKKCNNNIKRISSLVNQINNLNSYYNELSQTAFSNEKLDKLESNIMKVFKWGKPIYYDELFKK